MLDRFNEPAAQHYLDVQNVFEKCLRVSRVEIKAIESQESGMHNNNEIKLCLRKTSVETHSSNTQ
jgi:hypothetical protein